MKRTFQPSIVKRKRTHGFRARMATAKGRLVLKREFSEIFNQPRYRIAEGYLLVLANSNSSGEFARLGMVIGKKFIPRAVDRNRIKRLVREQFRLKSRHLASLDIIVMVRGKIKHSSNTVFIATLDRLFEQLPK